MGNNTEIEKLLRKKGAYNQKQSNIIVEFIAEIVRSNDRDGFRDVLSSIKSLDRLFLDEYDRSLGWYLATALRHNQIDANDAEYYLNKLLDHGASQSMIDDFLVGIYGQYDSGDIDVDDNLLTVLIELGATKESVSKALHEYISNRFDEFSEKHIHFLIEKGADINLPLVGELSFGEKISAINLAVENDNFDLAMLLINLGGKVDASIAIKHFLPDELKKTRHHRIS